MTKEEFQFIENNWADFACIPDGYCRHIDHNILSRYEEIYRNNLDANFLLTKWCGHCVYDMMKRLLAYFLEHKNKVNENPGNRRKK